MLTATQKKVKQELEELQANVLYHPEPGTVPPARKNSMKKRVYITIGIFALIIICSFLMIKFLTPNYKKTVTYLKIEQNYYRQSEKLLVECMEKNIVEVGKAKADQDALLKKMYALETPSDLKDHKQDLLDVLEQQQEILTLLSKTTKSNSLTLNKKIMELHVKQELALDSLLKAFEREKIKYILNEDGTIQYRVNGNVYEY